MVSNLTAPLKDQADFSGPEIILIGYNFCINFVSKFVILLNLYGVKRQLIRSWAFIQ